MATNVSIVRDRPQFKRTMRRPSHTFQLRTVPFAIQPFLLAPVLPGETLKNLLLQSRVVSDPVKSPLIGWWNEYYLFYVKHRDMAERTSLAEMMVDPTWTAASVKSETPVLTNYFAGQAGQDWIDWTAHCLDRVVEEYFRNEGEVSTDYLIASMPQASISGNNWLDSAVLTANYDPQSVDFNVDLDADTNITASEVDKAMMMWEHLRVNGLTQQTYEEYLATFGVSSPAIVEEPHRPELLRFARDWTYPSNTVDPATGTPTSALSWSVAERADKDRLFKEPGFIFGVTVKRPKVYMNKQSMSAASMMNDVYSWLPMTMAQAGHVGMKEITALKGALPAVTTDYWVDMNDLLQYGDQFINFALTETDAGMVALPTTGMEKRYPSLTDVQGLFVTGASKYFVREDGVVSMQIAGHYRDSTPTTAG